MKWMRILGLLWIAAGIGLAGGAARAAIELTEVEVSVAIETVNGASASAQKTITAQVVVSGSGITSVTITPPGTTTPVSLPLVSGDFVLEQTFNSDAALAAGLPAGNYTLQVSSGTETATATLAYSRPDVPSPAISKPANGSVVTAGSLTAQFSACSVCTLSEDSTDATLEQDGTTLASETLEDGAKEWVPSDDAGDPLQLAAASSFTLKVVHTASRSVAGTSGTSDAFTFRSILIQSDEVDFTTGFAAPDVAACLVVNGSGDAVPGLDETCSEVSDTLRGIVDVSGTVTRTAVGLPIDLDLTLSPKGKLSGIAHADLDGDGAKESHVPVKGNLSGSGGRLRQKVRFALEGGASAPGTSLRISLLERLLLPDGVNIIKRNTKGRLLGIPVKEKLVEAESIADLASGWRLDFDFSGDSGSISDASLVLANGRTVALTGRHSFDLKLDRTSLRLRSSGGDAGIKIEGDNLGFADDGTISRGTIRWRAFGQSGKLRFRSE